MNVYKVSFTQKELSVIMDALNGMPYGLALPLIQKLNAQIAGQKALLRKESEDDSVPVDSPSLENHDAFWAGCSLM